MIDLSPAPTPAPRPPARKSLAALGAAAVLLAGGAAVYWFFLRPTLLERAQKALAQGTPEVAAEWLLAHLQKPGLLPDEERPARQALAQAYLMKGAYDGAEEAFRELEKRFPEDPAAALGLGFLFFSRGQDAFAVEYLTKAKTLAPADPRPSQALASLYNFRGEYDQAREEALSLLNRAPTDAAARRLLGEAELGRGQYADAATAFETVLEASADDPGTRRLLARARLGAGDLAGTTQTLDTLLQANPNDPSALALKADALHARAKPEEAEALLRQVFETNPARFFAGISLARELARRGDTEAAQALMLDIGQRMPKPEDVAPPPYASFYEPWDNLTRRRDVRDIRVQYHLAMAEVYKSRYLFVDVERQTRLALQLSPRDPDALRAWTDQVRTGGDARAWLKAAQEAAHVFPLRPDIQLDHAEALLAVKKPQEALVQARAVAEACPALSRGPAVLAQIHLAENRRDDAAVAADTAASLNDRDPLAALAQGLVKAAKNDWRGAEKDFTRATTLDPLLARAHWELGKALDKQKKTRDAAQERERALELEPRVYKQR